MYVVVIIPVVVTTLLRFHPCSSGINDSRFLDIEKTNIYFAWPRATPRATLTHLSCPPNYPRASYLDERTADV